MSGPLHYGIELPQRCMSLVDTLWDHVSHLFGPEGEEFGPLTTTFLVSMSMPIINVPLERIDRQKQMGNAEGYADDRHVNQEAVAAFREVFRQKQIGDAPFFDAGAWRYVEWSDYLFNIARGLPDEVATALDDGKAAEDAASMQPDLWISVLRNALAHGGVAYLNEHGRSKAHEPTRMLAFASGGFAKGVCPSDEKRPCRANGGDLQSIRILRISEDDYRAFLNRWVDWLTETGASHIVAA